MKRVIFVRHAESEANLSADTKTLNVKDIPLTPLGVQQADEVAKLLPRDAGVIVVSPYIRTKQTALPYIKSFANPLVEEWEVEEFTYLDSVKYDGTTTNERRGIVDQYWARNDLHYQDAENAESFQGLIDRVFNVREKICSLDDDVIVVFSHGYFIRVFLAIHKHLSIGGSVTEEFKKSLMSSVAPVDSNKQSQIKNASFHEIVL